MNHPFLKIAGVDSLDKFYKKFPDEKTFMAKYGKQVKKLKPGGALAGSNPVGAVLQSAGDIVGGIQQMKDEKEQMLGAQQMQGVSNVALQASMTRPEQVKRKYVRPEDNRNTGEEFFPIYGAGTVLAKNGTEIANTFAPNTIYTDLEEAKFGLNLPEFKTFPNFLKDPMKQGTGKDVSDIYDFAQQGGGDALTQMTAGIGSPKGHGISGGGKVGKGIGTAAGSIFFGPVGGMVGGAIGQLAGNLLDRKAEKTEEAKKATDRNMELMAMNQGAQALQQQNYSYMEHGGFVNPQVATSLEGIPMKRLFAPDPMMDTLRAGGHLKSYTPPSERSMYTGREQFAMGGDLKVHRGKAEPMSYNPYLGSETVMFKGPSHDDGGMPIEFGENPVEVEGGEPAVKLRNGSDGSNNLTVYGNLKIPSYGASMIGDPKIAGTKFKNYVADLSKKENKQNKIMDKSVTALDELENISNPYDSLAANSYKSSMLGANMKLKDIADKKIKAASLQEAINNTAEEMGLSADALAKGKVMQAKMGAKITIAKDGVTTKEQRAKAKQLYESGDIKGFQKYMQEVAPDIVKTIIREQGMPSAGTFADALKGPRTEEAYKRFMNPIAYETPGSRLPERKPEIQLPKNMPGVSTERPGAGQASEATESPFDWMSIANQILPYVRPSDAESLDPRQLAGEMYALSTNQVEPVDAQLFQPQLSTPYDISLQDQLNANQSDYRAAQRMMGYNPAAQAMLNAQKYQANQQVLGEQFRMNQAMKDQTYRENRSLLDQANLQNLQILDQQYGRQQQALSNTKATTQAALNSIASKYAQNQLENRQLQTYENLYNYRFDQRGRAMNMNPLAQFSTQMDVPVYDEDGNLVEIKRQTKDKYDKSGLPAGRTVTTETKEKKRNGALVKAIKSM